MASVPQAIRALGSGITSQAVSMGISILGEMGPENSNTSACFGLATERMPSLSESNTELKDAFNSHSTELFPPAATSRYRKPDFAVRAWNSKSGFDKGGSGSGVNLPESKVICRALRLRLKT